MVRLENGTPTAWDANLCMKIKFSFAQSALISIIREGYNEKRLGKGNSLTSVINMGEFIDRLIRFKSFTLMDS